MVLKRKVWIPVFVLLPCAMLMMTSPAQAGMVGDTVTCAITASQGCSQASNVVGGGVEFTFGNAGGSQFFSVDFRASDVVFTATSAIFGPGSYIFSSTDTTHAFTSESLISMSGFVDPFGASNISLSGGTLAVNLSGVTFNVGTTFDIGLNTAPVIATPEPAAAGLVGVGSMLLIAWMRKRRKANLTLV